ncbi:MAG: GGDEF domain-containing protein [Pirellulales bacterium]|nr:GGDEF domain-containing protein [Pirellulales bacterium]
MEFWNLSLPAPLALAVVATLGYLMGRRTRSADHDLVARSRRELRRAKSVARELEKIAGMVRRNLARHHTSLSRFKQRVGQLSHQQQDAAWKDLCREASEILTPTLRLATQIANAYDQIRQQTNHLMTFTEIRTDPLTGISNRRALDDAMASQLAMFNRYDTRFSVAIFDIDHFKRVNDEQGHLQGDQMLQRLARLLDESVRETDVLVRYGGEEFVVVMPQTSIEGACVFAERLRGKVEREMEITVSGGVAEALDGDTAESLMSRADTALYSAKGAGRNTIHRHTGDHAEPMLEVASV